ncbi:phosphopantetheine-binding protein [Xenorhabdus szentirmaii]|nr:MULTISPECIES: phosphopantetheine-binding protein [Xenorhabdus]MBD2779297.1 acyl carrier protein [Xenorhabdus sp. 38]MBD2791249.1 acyl carrier protein [Xenorhabdus sp. CUL]MBD2802923.1 acyl carrier protein [Xenorhabdus sp. M]MBD2804716.1 acyl carrier protein [Xenorhabdus sp. ZM]MBD2821944.1 acyl carrier protein [Xenorhabdus sp. 42]
MQELHIEIKQLIIDTLNLEDLLPADIETDAPLFGDGLGLDSIDALELGLAVKNRYSIVLSSESEEMRQHFASVATLAAYIQSQQV